MVIEQHYSVFVKYFGDIGCKRHPPQSTSSVNPLGSMYCVKGFINNFAI